MLLIPMIAGVALLLVTWSMDLLPRPLLTGACVLAGVVAQWFAPTFSVIWVLALLFNVGMGIYMIIRLKLGQ